MGRVVTPLQTVGLLFIAASSLASTCEETTPGGPCPSGLVRVGTGITACTPRCALPSTDREFAACPQGFMCSGVTGCYLTCGTSACYPGERCDGATMRCERVPDGGAADASADVVTPPADIVTPPADIVTPPADVVTPPADVVTPRADVVTPPADVVTPPADVVTPPADIVTPPADVVTPPADSGVTGRSCSMGLPSTGTTTLLGSGNGVATSLRLAVNDTHVAWSDGTNIVLVRADGVSVGTLPRADVQHIALSATHLYYASGGASSSISRVPIADFATATPERIRESAAYIPSFALGPDGILWAQEDASAAQFFRAELDGRNALIRGALSFQGRSGERVVDMGVAGAQLYVATQRSLGTTGCFRVVRFDAGPMMPSTAEPTVVYGPTASSCTAASYANLAFDGSTVFFHSSSPPEVVQYALGSTASRFWPGQGDGTFLGVTARCLIGVSGGELFGMSRALPIDETSIRLTFSGAPLTRVIGRIAVRGAYVYGFVMNRSQYTVFRHGL